MFSFLACSVSALLPVLYPAVFQVFPMLFKVNKNTFNWASEIVLDDVPIRTVVEIVCRFLFWMSVQLPSFDLVLDRRAHAIAA